VNEDSNAQRAQRLSRNEFAALFQRLKSTADRGAADRKGALNFLTAAQVTSAAREVRLGRSVSLARPIETEPAADDPEPARYEMTGALAAHHLARGLEFATDRFAMNVHGDAASHVDALCHVVFDSKLYNDVPVDDVTPRGAITLSIDVIQDGVVGRGVLLDIPRLHGRPWLEPGEAVTGEDLRAAAEAQQVHVGQGDLLFVRVGHFRRRQELGPWEVAQARAGLHPTALEFVADRGVAVLGSDSNNDVAPSRAEGVDFPVHVLAVNALGVHLLDYLQFEDLVGMCKQEQRWTFLVVIAPLRLPGATGSPVNPIAIL
jgi:kynurenine formamidase